MLFKYFVLEAYKIPTGSMQPTLMGWSDGKGGGVFDRVIVDKLSYRFRDPERWEIAVFRYPLDSSKNFIKRIVGMPGEELRIEDGDLFTRPDASEPWSILRKPRAQDTQLKELDHGGKWTLTGDWSEGAEGDLVVSGEGEARVPRATSAVVDRYADGYPGKLAQVVRSKPAGSSRFRVGDLRLTCEVEPAADCRLARLELLEGDWVYALELPGPAAIEGTRARLALTHTRDESLRRRIALDGITSLSAGDTVEVALPTWTTCSRSPWTGARRLRGAQQVAQADVIRSGVRFATADGGAAFRAVSLARDIYYPDDQKVTSWDIPEDSYVVLGDNTQDSSDSRDWMLIGFQLPDGREVWGNQRTRENPVFAQAHPGGPQVFFRDQLGELHVFPNGAATPLPPSERPRPRELVRGRAVMVVWPPRAFGRPLAPEVVPVSEPERAVLEAAYRATAYEALGPGVELDLRVDERSAALDALLTSTGRTSWAFLTAWNPGSQPLAPEENAERRGAWAASRP